MRPARSLAVAALLAAVAAPAAHADHRKISGSQDLRLPVPYPLEDTSGSHCAGAPKDLSKFQKMLTLPKAGKLRVELTGFTGDWVIELFDQKGTMVASAANMSASAAGATMTYKKKNAAKQPITIMVCNFAGAPDARVAWTFVYH